MKIKELSMSYIEMYNNISMEQGSIFNTYEWLKIFDNISIYGIFDEGDNLIGGFHLYKEKKFGITIYRNPPFTPFIGPFIKIESQNPVKVANKYREILSLMAEFLSKLNYSIIFVSLSRNIIDTLPFIWKKFKVSPGYTYTLDLNKPLDNLFKNMTIERRNDINKAIRDKLIIEKVNDFAIIKSLVLKTFFRQGKNINEYYLNKILFEFANDSNSFAFVTFRDKKPIAGAFCIYDKLTAYYLIGGYDYEFKHHGAGALALWKAIEYSKEIGLKYFDFEGSMIPQIERYFRGFGGELKPYFRINKAWLPIEVLLKFYKREIF
jgi:lipid II:glycine glycyltransferase (peptidoglycan interpeptide bridge formation enzyme)